MGVRIDEAATACHQTPGKHSHDNQPRTADGIRQTAEWQAEHGIKNGEAETDQEAHFGVGDSEVAANGGDEEIQNLAVNEREDVGAEENRDGVPGPGGGWIGLFFFQRCIYNMGLLVRAHSRHLVVHKVERKRPKLYCMQLGLAASFLLLVCAQVFGGTRLGRVSGRIFDPQGAPVANVHVLLLDERGRTVQEASSDSEGRFQCADIGPGHYKVRAEISSFAPVSADVTVVEGQEVAVELKFVQIASVRQAVTVVGTSAPSSLTPDPSERIVVHDQVRDANPGRPGAPISIPGYPIETASGGIKAPQYFAPGVAGDHGEPIAQFYQIGDFLYPNNLPANAHGNGYADPNFLIAPMIEAVAIDGGAFNVREGNNSVDLAATYVPRERLNSFVELT